MTNRYVILTVTKRNILYRVVNNAFPWLSYWSYHMTKLTWLLVQIAVQSSDYDLNWNYLFYMLSFYKHSLHLYKLFNDGQENEDWVDANFNQSFYDRCDKVKFFHVSNLKVGRNLITNRLTIINNKIKYDWLNKSYYITTCKSTFLS